MSVISYPAWQALQRHKESIEKNKISFNDLQRLKNFDIALGGLRLNYAFQNVTPETIELLLDLAKEQKVENWRTRMFAGEKINQSENRAVLHTALRHQDHTPVMTDGTDVMPDIRAAQKRIATFVDEIREGTRTGATGKRIRSIVNIGIGGSDLGPRLVAQALYADIHDMNIHFVANVDAFDLENVLEKVDAAETLFVVVSKTFTTPETLLNASSARLWLTDKLGEKAVPHHFVAVSTNATEVEKFGISTDIMFPLWDWVGGRYSVWSAVGLSVALAIGSQNFKSFLAGAEAMDKHFLSAPLKGNMPVLLAMLGIWNRNFWDAGALAVLPYCERLRDLPRFLQQLDMESNGKSVTRQGTPVDYSTGPIVFGECGSVSQHSFHQWLHQGSDVIPADFIGISEDDLNQPEHHKILLQNLAAQIGTLILGQKDAKMPQDIYAGGRPSNLILLERLDPYHLGMLLALYEHKVFVQGVIWEINSFDQPGVELGKRMAKGLQGANETTSSSIVDALFKSLTS
jgi:glucose-6-phosphate isomerase